jgi:hypothetical protein
MRSGTLGLDDNVLSLKMPTLPADIFPDMTADNQNQNSQTARQPSRGNNRRQNQSTPPPRNQNQELTSWPLNNPWLDDDTLISPVQESRSGTADIPVTASERARANAAPETHASNHEAGYRPSPANDPSAFQGLDEDPVYGGLEIPQYNPLSD